MCVTVKCVFFCTRRKYDGLSVCSQEDIAMGDCCLLNMQKSGETTRWAWMHREGFQLVKDFLSSRTYFHTQKVTGCAPRLHWTPCSEILFGLCWFLQHQYRVSPAV